MGQMKGLPRMEDAIHYLEIKIQKLVRQCEQLKEDNLQLRQSKARLIREKELLLAKNKVAIVQIENMVSRLKSIEKPQ